MDKLFELTFLFFFFFSNAQVFENKLRYKFYIAYK